MFFNNRKCGCGCDMNNNMNMDMNYNYNMNNCPIMEPAIEKCVQKDIYHEVEHICPINTKIINNHIYKHQAFVHNIGHNLLCPLDLEKLLLHFYMI